MLYAGLIIALSSIPNLQSPRLGIFSTDKLIHFIEYAVFAFLFYRSFAYSLSQSRRSNSGLLVALMTFALLLLFSVGDEYHQKFVPGRSADVFDVIADILGGALVILFLHRRNKPISKIS
jgi:VanZ family protein